MGLKVCCYGHSVRHQGGGGGGGGGVHGILAAWGRGAGSEGPWEAEGGGQGRIRVDPLRTLVSLRDGKGCGHLGGGRGGSGWQKMLLLLLGEKWLLLTQLFHLLLLLLLLLHGGYSLGQRLVEAVLWKGVGLTVAMVMALHLCA